MYTQYWQLATRPFEDGWPDQKTSDEESSLPASYYPSETHQAALLKLRYAIENGRGAALLAGGTGLGKTMLVQLLREQLDERYQPLVHLVFPQMEPEELLALLAAELGAPVGDAHPTVHSSVLYLQQTLAENARSGRHAVIAIDEAQLLEETGGLDTLRLLMNVSVDGATSFTLLLVGDTELLPAVDRRPALEQRLAVKCLLQSLSLDETASYVTHRLRAAGATRAIFDDEAINRLFHLTRGAPRQINRLCDLALLIGYAEQHTSITPAHLESVSQELVTVAAE